MHKIVGHGSPASPSCPGRRHVAQVLGHRGQVGYRHVSEITDVLGGVRQPQYTLCVRQVEDVGDERYHTRVMMDVAIQDTEEVSCAQGQPCLFLQFADQGGFHGLIQVYAPTQEAIDTRLVPTFGMQQHTAPRPLDGQHHLAPPVSGAIQPRGE